MTNPWLRPEVAQQQRALNDRQLAENPWPAHFTALVDAVRATQCPGQILEVGCGVGHGREILDRAGVAFERYQGLDISEPALAIARERYPDRDSKWFNEMIPPLPEDDIVIDGSCVLHVEKWREHLAALCRASRRFVILHRVPVSTTTERTETRGYGQTFPAWSFHYGELADEMLLNGFEHVAQRNADGDSMTLTFAKPRHWASYCDAAYLPRLKALHASMVRHCGPFELHVLAWDDAVEQWCDETDGVTASSWAQFIEYHPDLWPDKLPGSKRTRVEYMWTCGPQWIADVMEACGEPVTYADADLLFFSSPEPMFAEIGGAPAAVVPHGFAEASRGLPGPTRETHEVFGKFNVGIVYAADRSFIERWAGQCREWCYDRIEGSRYGDQRYLDDCGIPPGRVYCGLPPGDPYFAHVIRHPGACAGPWQVHTRALDVRDGVIHFGNRPLIAYHFSGYREGPHGAESLSRPEYQISERQAEIIYAPYVKALRGTK